MSIMFPLYTLISVPAAEVNSGSARVGRTMFSNLEPSHITWVVW